MPLPSTRHEKFLQVGGKVETRTIYDVDKARVDASIAPHHLTRNRRTDPNEEPELSQARSGEDPMNWNRVLERHGYRFEQELLNMTVPPTRPAGTQKGEPPAHISLTATNGGDFGQLKVTAMVSITCSQDERSINLAAEIAFRKVIELVNDGSSHVGLNRYQSCRTDHEHQGHSTIG